jgi:predicted Zn-dependent protease
MRLRSLVLLSLLASPARAAPPAPGPVPASPVLDAMKAELGRSMKELKLKGYDAPYFISYEVVDREASELDARFGTLFGDTHQHERRILADVRVGSYDFDSSGVDPMSDIDLSQPDPGYQARRDAPLDDDPAALRQALWLLTDEKYKGALTTYLRKKARAVNSVESEDKTQTPSQSREKPAVVLEAVKPVPFDHDRWARLARRLSERFKAHPELFDSEVKVDLDRQVRHFVSSEGSELLTQQAMYSVHLWAATRAADGQLLDTSRDLYAPTEGQLPSDAALDAAADQLTGQLLAMRVAPVADPYTGPALLAPEATGVLFHEAVGHRLEGDRQDDDTEGRTFKGQVGNAVLPTFLTVVDDPTAVAQGPVALNGFYRYDEQGVAGQRTPLVEKGVLRGYLLSRRMVKGFDHSNGHGRAAPGRTPAARMSNLVVTGDGTHQKSWEALKAQLIEEAKRQGKPYGLIIRDMSGGNTNTSGYGYQAFKGQPRLVFRVDVATGKETLVRGVEMVGTPLTVINKLVALGDTPGVFNGYCGAESGFIPVSTVAPAALINEIELQRNSKTNQKPPLLPSPWAK